MITRCFDAASDDTEAAIKTASNPGRCCSLPTVCEEPATRRLG